MNFEKVIESNKETIYRICKVYATSPIEPQDLFQEVVFEIWKSISNFKKRSNINTWIYRIALNVCMRSKLKFDKKDKGTIQFDSIHFMAASNESVEEEDEKYILLKECITALNEVDKSIVVLYLEDLSYRDISEITGLTENHVAVKMKRIRKKLFDCINSKLG